MESPYHILVVIKIHPCFPADAGIHLGKKGRRDLYKTDTPEIAGRRKARHIPRNSSAESYQQIMAVKVMPDQESEDLPYLVQILVLLTRRDHIGEYFTADRRQKVHNLLKIQFFDIAVGHYNDPPAGGIQLFYLLRQLFKRTFRIDPVYSFTARSDIDRLPVARSFLLFY